MPAHIGPLFYDSASVHRAPRLLVLNAMFGFQIGFEDAPCFVPRVFEAASGIWRFAGLQEPPIFLVASQVLLIDLLRTRPIQLWPI